MAWIFRLSLSISVYRLNGRAVGAEVSILGKSNNANSFKLCFIDQGETPYMVGKEHPVSCYTLMKLCHNFLAFLTLTYALHYIANPNPNHASYNIILNATLYTAPQTVHILPLLCYCMFRNLFYGWRTMLQQISERFQFRFGQRKKHVFMQGN